MRWHLRVNILEHVAHRRLAPGMQGAMAFGLLPKTGALGPNTANAGLYSSTLHYLKAVADVDPSQAKNEGAAVIARMKANPTDDDAFGRGSIREDGRKLHPAYLMQVKSPSQSTGPYEVLK
jgi:branched-chain amino acid transport system substrate-binding protein